MLADYLPVAILLILGTVLAFGFIGLSHLVGARRPTKVKLEPYECGVEPVGGAHQRFSVKFYLVGMLFISPPLGGYGGIMAMMICEWVDLIRTRFL